VHKYLAVFHPRDVHQGFIVLLFLVDMRELVVPHHQWDGEARHELCKRLAQADSLTTEERTEGHGVAWFTVGFLEPGRGRVKAIGDPACGFLPLVEVVVDGFHVDKDRFTFVQFDAVDLDILREGLQGGDRDRRFDSQCLIEAVAHEIQIVSIVLGHLGHHVVTYDRCDL